MYYTKWKQSCNSLNDDYEYALKWKIHDTLGRLGYLEDILFFFRRYIYAGLCKKPKYIVCFKTLILNPILQIQP